MKTQQLFATFAALTLAGAAFAQNAPATATSAALTAGAGAALATGAANAATRGDSVQIKAAPAGRTRAEVIAEVVQARKDGTLQTSELDFDVAQTRKHIAQ
ncbi:DUF4148 domain-containing protein [Oxalobacteraceae bacterium]|nr:DUF4148 domain-containing protein [Oxalobacteraceae bacterium]